MVGVGWGVDVDIKSIPKIRTRDFWLRDVTLNYYVILQRVNYVLVGILESTFFEIDKILRNVGTSDSQMEYLREYLSIALKVF